VGGALVQSRVNSSEMAIELERGVPHVGLEWRGSDVRERESEVEERGS
jgi:hypothetical protein